MARNPPRATRARPRQAGTGSVEFALVATLFLVLVFGIIDFARISWEWNAAAKATQWGARYAALNPLVATALRDVDGLAAAGGNGRPAPHNTVQCTDTACGGSSRDAAVFTGIVNRMRVIYGRVAAENVVVTYRYAGLGTAGNPFGPGIAPLVTVELRNMTFTFVTPGLNGLVSLNLPAFATTMPTEDPV